MTGQVNYCLPHPVCETVRCSRMVISRRANAGRTNPSRASAAPVSPKDWLSFSRFILFPIARRESYASRLENVKENSTPLVSLWQIDNTIRHAVTRRGPVRASADLDRRGRFICLRLHRLWRRRHSSQLAPQSGPGPGYASLSSSTRIGSARIRRPVAAASALATAGATTGVPGSPTPVGFSVEATM